MKDTLKNELWEALIKTAVIQYTYEENSSIPTEKQLETIDLPVNYEKKLNTFVKKYAAHEKRKSLLFLAQKIASIILIIMGISFVYLLHFEEIRAACHNLFIEIHEKYIQIDFIPNGSENEHSSKLNNLPDGFYLTQSFGDDTQSYWRYENTSGDIIELFVFFQERTTYIDNEHYNLTDIQINDCNGKFFESNDSNFLNYAIWNTDAEYFKLCSSLPKDLIIKLAENVN